MSGLARPMAAVCAEEFEEDEEEPEAEGSLDQITARGAACGAAARKEISIADWRDVAGRFVIALAGCCDEEDEQDSDRCQREPRVDLAAWQGVGCGLARAIAACEPDE
mmetsp:Transcript_42500/g.110632  ORF Transcript_42500/g.110632 Transcript_42500/m.110632 type:complete len:108 (-) Transcript_42500:198-521(-)